jgi:hypothetical protein
MKPVPPASLQDPVGAVEAWQARGVTPADPVRLAIVRALARRAAAHQGPARELLVQRLQAWLAAAPAPAGRAAAQGEPEARRRALAGLAQLVDRLGRTPPAPGPAAPSGGTSPQATAPRPLRAVLAHQATWLRLRAEQRLRQAGAQVPAQAGPLNSSQVVHRALQTLHGLSPAYLDAFMSHVDTLLWLEQAGDQARGGALSRGGAAAGAGSGRRQPAPPGRRGNGGISKRGSS